MPSPPAESITPQQIEREPNVELRRILLERFGAERYLQETQTIPVQQDAWGTLFRKGVPGLEPIVLVRVVNSSPEPDGTFKTYQLRVPPWIQTAREAVAWTFGLSSTSYAPLQET